MRNLSRQVSTRRIAVGSRLERARLHTTPAPGAGFAIALADVRAAAERLRGVANRTPVLTSRTVDQLVGAHVFFKCENLQRAGAFKFRGAYNRLVCLSPEERRRGIVAFSSGNHAQGVALAARELGIRATVVMPDDAPALKVAATARLRRRGRDLQPAHRRPRSDRHAPGRRARPDPRAAVQPPADHGRPGHRGSGAHRRRRDAGLAAHARRWRRPAFGLRHRRHRSAAGDQGRLASRRRRPTTGCRAWPPAIRCISRRPRRSPTASAPRSLAR